MTRTTTAKSSIIEATKDGVRMRESVLYVEVSGAVRVDMQPGDLMLHDITLFHGSPATHNSPSIRRVVYYKFRDARFGAACTD